MSDWSLPRLLAGLHDDIQTKLQIVRGTLAHPGTKGNGSEDAWLKLLQAYLPQRYEADTAHIVDSEGNFSQQIDVVVFDRQYSPFIFHYQGQKVIPAESVYAVFEAKQSINSTNVVYAQEKIASVRKLYRTSLPIPYAKGVYPPKPLIPILGGLLTFESDWSPPLGESLKQSLEGGDPYGKLDIGCIAAHGHFFLHNDSAIYDLVTERKPATTFLFKLISQLQFSGTVPMIDVQAYSRWLTE